MASWECCQRMLLSLSTSGVGSPPTASPFLILLQASGLGFQFDGAPSDKKNPLSNPSYGISVMGKKHRPPLNLRFGPVFSTFLGGGENNGLILNRAPIGFVPDGPGGSSGRIRPLSNAFSVLLPLVIAQGVLPIPSAAEAKACFAHDMLLVGCYEACRHVQSPSTWLWEAGKRRMG